MAWSTSHARTFYLIKINNEQRKWKRNQAYSNTFSYQNYRIVDTQVHLTEIITSTLYKHATTYERY